MAIVQSIMEIVEQQAAIYRAKRVAKISLEFGVLTGVQPDAVRFAFEILAKDGIAEAAALEITIVPMKAFCPTCAKEYLLRDYTPFCPDCETTALQIIEGRDEMRIASMEIEDTQ
ncbi:MAG: hydrogenase maturation nickel metallochaperone HypA [Pseudomonadota bacterium]